jgi:hypothetical protein
MLPRRELCGWLFCLEGVRDGCWECLDEALPGCELREIPLRLAGCADFLFKAGFERGFGM